MSESKSRLSALSRETKDNLSPNWVTREREREDELIETLLNLLVIQLSVQKIHE